MTQIVGYKRKTGSFTDDTGREVKYDFMSIYYISDEVNVDEGQYAGFAKVKPEALKIVGAKTLEEALNKDVILVPDLQNPKYIARIVVL